MLIKWFEESEWHLTTGDEKRRREFKGEKATIDDPLVTVETLAELWADECENANYHSQTEIAEQMVTILRSVGVDEHKVKAVLWQMVVEHGCWI